MPLDLSHAYEADLRYAEDTIRFSICTLMTDKDQYAAMVQSIRSGGFDQNDCEFLYLDNSAANRFDAFEGINIFLQAAKGRHIIICHQDIALLQDGRPELEAAIQRLDSVDPSWAVFGNAGAQEGGDHAIHITDPAGFRHVGGPFPVKVQSLDENFLVIRRSANLAVSRRLSGFHLYGTEICQVAERLGFGAYVVDFHLRHFSSGTFDERFFAQRYAYMQTIGPLYAPKWITTVCTGFPLTNSDLLWRLARSPRGAKLVKSIFVLMRWFKVAIGLETRTAKRSGPR
jgi:hypothetical protein